MGRPFGLPEDVSELSSATNVTALGVLFPFRKLGDKYHTLLFVLQNTSATETVSLVVETSEDGLVPDGHMVWTVTAAPEKQASVEVGPGLLRQYWRLSATTDGSTVPVKWAVRGIHRST